MTSLLIVYHSQSGASAALARAALAGASAETGVQARLLRACDAGVADLVEASGLLLVAAENSGSLSGGAKEFLDRVFYPAIDRQLVLPYALLVSAGNDGRGAVRQAERIFKGIPFKVANPPQIFRGEPGEEELAAAFDTGQALAAGLGMGIF
ncbi:flavodoxin [Seongchinamella sediminis]|uniref:Flavodoxin n=2 Tax=Seongchinamella sediminis TaxID=2283635 RepID=A0A3L7E364_9GAMM|nr:flavodoxin [Seongchinamella sediminis]